MTSGQPGYLALLLHAHLPFVRHPEHDDMLEEQWLYQAITESYLPLLGVLERCEADGLDAPLNLVLSPPLVAMLDDELLRARYTRHLERLRALADAEVARTADDGHLHYLATHYRDRFADVAARWHRLDGRLVPAFADLQNAGRIEILACAATHGYLPLLQAQPAAVWAQIKIGVDQYRAAFGRAPRGFWLPECGYYPGLDAVLARAGLRYFVVDTHGVMLADPRPRHDSFAPIITPDTGLVAFARDPDCSAQVWSREHGYPAHTVYREYYRDLAHELPASHVGRYLPPTVDGAATGIKYHRITGPTENKALYDPHWARKKTDEHAADFLLHRQYQLAHVGRQMAVPPVVVAPFDAELFGHWWYEGPWWLEGVLRRGAHGPGGVQLCGLSDYLARAPTQQVAAPAQSSWGVAGFHDYWVNETNAWIYPHLYRAAERMVALAEAFAGADPDVDELTRRALDQCARELLVAQSSDWAFIMRSGTMVAYARRRTETHLQRFTELARQIEAHAIDASWLEAIEARDNLFATLDYRVYAAPA